MSDLNSLEDINPIETSLLVRREVKNSSAKGQGNQEASQFSTGMKKGSELEKMANKGG